MFYVGLTCPQDHCLFDGTRYVVSLSLLFSDTLYSENINSWRSYYRNIFLLAWYISCPYALFSVILIVFAIKKFHKQLHVKDRQCSVEAAIYKTAVFSTCQKQNEYFDKEDVARLLTCYIYNGAFCENSLRLDSTNSYHYKELYHRLGKVPKVYLFR